MIPEFRAYLLDEPDILTKPVEIQFLDGPAVEFDRARRGLVPSLDEADNGTLAGTTLALVKCQSGSQRRTFRGLHTTKAVTLPAGTLSVKSCRTVVPGRVG